LTVIPPPTFQTIAQTNGTITFAWSTVSGQQYQVQYNTNLPSANWINLGNVMLPTNSLATYSEPITPGTRRFYRVVLLP
jgi:hypothetical protein